MENVKQYRVIIIDQEGQIFKYKKQLEQLHQDCYNEFALEKKYYEKDRNIKEIVKRGNVVISNLAEDYFAIFMPPSLSDSQLYMLELMEDTLNQVKEIYSEFLDGKSFESFNNAGTHFLKTAVQYYYNNENEKLK